MMHWDPPATSMSPKPLFAAQEYEIVFRSDLFWRLEFEEQMLSHPISLQEQSPAPLRHSHV